MQIRFFALPAVVCLALVVAGCGSSNTSTPAKKPAAKSSTPAKSTSGTTTSSATKGGAGMGGSMMMYAPSDPTVDPRGQCAPLNSGFPGDEACILPPEPGTGMQIHVGPTDYKNPDQINKFLLKAGMETENCWTFHTPNTSEVYYQTFVLSARAGSHHIIDTMYSVEITDGGFVTCMDPGTGTNGNILDNLPGASKPYMPRMPVAPENEHVGRKIPANTPSQADMHNFNFTDKDELREFWMNIYFTDKAQITDEATQIRGMGGLSWSVAPIAMGTDKTYSYSCPITTDGRIIALLGHYHSHGKRFSASIKHKNGDIEKVFEMYDYLEPAEFTYDTITTNPDFSDSAAGAVSGILDVQAGDTMLWDCHIINDDQPGGLRYVNQVKTGEMCNLWGESLGPKINCVVF